MRAPFTAIYCRQNATLDLLGQCVHDLPLIVDNNAHNWGRGSSCSCQAAVMEVWTRRAAGEMSVGNGHFEFVSLSLGVIQSQFLIRLKKRNLFGGELLTFELVRGGNAISLRDGSHCL